MTSFEITFEAPKGEMIHRYFHGVTALGSGLWWSHVRKRWETYEQYEKAGKGGCSTHAPCRTFKAFKRHLRKHPELSASDKVVLVNRYVGYNIFACAK